jgi:hypothetical protein
VFVDELGETQGTSHASRSAANNDDIGFHRGVFDAGDWFSKNDH